MDPRVNMLMTGAKNIPALRKFYEEGLGWTPWGQANDNLAMYKLGTAVLVFMPAAYLAAESGISAAETPKIINAIFVPTKEDVDRDFAQAVAAGATVTSPIRDRDGGLYSGYFADPEGNGWEVVWSPHMPLGPDGGLTFAGA